MKDNVKMAHAILARQRKYYQMVEPMLRDSSRQEKEHIARTLAVPQVKASALTADRQIKFEREGDKVTMLTLGDGDISWEVIS